MLVVNRCYVQILNPLGLHLRAASKFIQLAGQYESDLKVGLGARKVDGKSMLDLMTLAAEFGARLELEASGTDAEAMLAALTELTEMRFHETEEG